MGPRGRRGRRARRPARAGRSAVVLLAGIVLVALGAGLGLAHLAASGWGPVAVGGTAALALGAALLAAGAVGLVRATPGWWRALALPAVLVVALLGVYVLAVPLRAAVPARAPVDAAPRSEVEEVTVPTADGERLAGWFAPADGGATVVLLPGAGSSRAAVVDHLDALVAGGHGVLALDPRGQGRSTGRGMDWGWYGEQDVPAAVDSLARRDDVDAGRIAVVGLSMGGEQAIGALAADPRIRAVVAEGVTGRSAVDLAWLSEPYGWRGMLTEGLHAATTAVADVLSPAEPPPSLRAGVAAAAPRPVLLVVAGEVPDEQHAAEAIRSAAPDSVESWTVPGAGHVAALRTDPRGWSDRVLGFLDDEVG